MVFVFKARNLHFDVFRAPPKPTSLVTTAAKPKPNATSSTLSTKSSPRPTTTTRLLATEKASSPLKEKTLNKAAVTAKSPRPTTTSTATKDVISIYLTILTVE